MINCAPEVRETVDERLVPENMINTKAIRRRTPSPFLPVAMPRTPQIDEASVAIEGLKKVGTMEARASAFDVEIVSARV